jgi:hypothetical protein
MSAHRIDTKRYSLSWSRIVHLELEVVNGYSSVGINGSLHSQLEDILHRLKRWSHLKVPKQRFLLLQRPLKPEVGHLLGGGMDLFVVVPVDLVVQHPLGLSDIGHTFPHLTHVRITRFRSQPYGRSTLPLACGDRA